MPATYQDEQGWMTRDYNMDAADVAAARAGSTYFAGRDPTQSSSPYAAENQWAASTKYNTLAAAANTAAEASRQALWDTQNSGVNSLNMGRTLLDNSSPEALDASRFKRAALIPGGTNLFSQIYGGHTEATDLADPRNVTSQPIALPGAGPKGMSPTNPLSRMQGGTLAIDPLDSLSVTANGKKALPGQRLPTDLMSHPKFRELMATNPDGAKQLYKAVEGRDLDQDKAAQAASLAEQHTAQTTLAAKYADKVFPAMKDNPDLDVKKGDYIERSILPSSLPGIPAQVVETPLPENVRQVLGLKRTGDVNTIEPTGGSVYSKSTGMGSNPDVDHDLRLGLRLRKKKDQDTADAANAAAYEHRTKSGVSRAVPFSQQQTAGEQRGQINWAGFEGSGDAGEDFVNKLSNFGYNTGVSLYHGIDNVMSTFDSSYRPTDIDYETPEQTRARMRAEAAKGYMRSEPRSIDTARPAYYSGSLY